MKIPRVLVMCVVLVALHSIAGARPLTRREVAPALLEKKGEIASKPPQATPWPEEFTMAFTTDDGAASGLLYYDWGNKQQVIVHGQGASHCRMRGSAGACYIVENSRGTFEVDPVARTCEITSKWGSVPPTWVVPGVFVGTVDVNGVQCTRFDYPPSMHSWLETVDDHLPCAFLFPTPSFNYIFSPSTLHLGKPPSDIFTIPDYCPKEITSVAPLKEIL